MASLIQFDATRCIGCGECLLVCPSRILEQKGAGEVPFANQRAEACINCGHCVAFCPRGAISVGAMTAETLPPARQEALPRFEQFSALVAQRRSIRKFRSEPVEAETLQKLFDLIRMAPTAKNLLPLQWTVVNDPQKTRHLSELVLKGIRLKGDERFQPLLDAWENGYDWILRGAPCLIFAHTDENSNWTEFDSTIAAQIVDLAAPLLGLGSCWAGYFISSVRSNPFLREEIGLKKSDKIGAALMLGVPDHETYTKIPARPEPNIRYL